MSAEHELVERLRRGDEAAFRELVREYGGRLARLARSFCRTDAVIEEAVQETWLAVILGLHAFEGRAPLRSWLFGILVNQARRLGVREHRHRRDALGGLLPDPGAAAAGTEPLPDEPEREAGIGTHGHWEEPPAPWQMGSPEGEWLTRELAGVVEAAIAGLPEAQRQVVLLRDVEGLEPEQVCNILSLQDTHQRVLLHRGRARVRQALHVHLHGAPADSGAARTHR